MRACVCVKIEREAVFSPSSLLDFINKSTAVGVIVHHHRREEVPHPTPRRDKHTLDLFRQKKTFRETFKYLLCACKWFLKDRQ